ncbi:MAG: hypothetical protein Q8R25_01565 [bacterium]|nr:hypothetical protein [bacterium]
MKRLIFGTVFLAMVCMATVTNAQSVITPQDLAWVCKDHKGGMSFCFRQLIDSGKVVVISEKMLTPEFRQQLEKAILESVRNAFAKKD